MMDSDGRDSVGSMYCISTALGILLKFMMEAIGLKVYGGS